MINQMDKMTENSAQYIQRWQEQQAQDIPHCTYFFFVKCGQRFRLPGGNVVQTKTKGGKAQTNSQIVYYLPWERVVPLD